MHVCNTKLKQIVINICVCYRKIPTLYNFCVNLFKVLCVAVIEIITMKRFVVVETALTWLARIYAIQPLYIYTETHTHTIIYITTTDTERRNDYIHVHLFSSYPYTAPPLHRPGVAYLLSLVAHRSSSSSLICLVLFAVWFLMLLLSQCL